jgi:3-hydroxyacyl-CoA dehydrogenase
MLLAMKLTSEMHLTVEEVDKLTGSVIGHPKSATYRTADLVGLDTLVHVAQTAYEKCTADESRELFKIPEILQKLIENKWLGAKTKKGFYTKVEKDILSLDFEKFEYVPQKKVRMDGIRVAKREWTIAGKIKALAYSDDIAGKFTWELLANTLIYSANHIPEITEDIVNIDKAMKWGFGWELGPFETWEAMGLSRSLERMSAEGKPIPEWVKELAKNGQNSFYNMERGKINFFDIPSKMFKALKENPKLIRLNVLKANGKELRKNWNASLIDLEDGVALVEFHSIIQPNFNPIDGATLDMISDGIEYVKSNGFKALIIGHQGQHFSVGINLALILKYAEERNWDKLEQLSATFQNINQKIRFSDIPVVAAPFNMCLGGGFELIGACDARVTSAELYCGLVEFGVGLIPGGGGNLRLLLNNLKAMSAGRPGPFPAVQKTFETIGFAKVSTSAKEAVFLGYLTKDDKIVINPDHLIYEAKQETLRLTENYRPSKMEKEIILPGSDGCLAIEVTLENLVKGGTISQHDALIGKKLAHVLTGGDKASPFKPVDEQYLLDIEREVFVSLCAENLSQKRMMHMLKTGKPLRN